MSRFSIKSLRLVHQLWLLLLLVVMLAVLLVGAVMVSNLRHGFSDYVRQRDRLQMQRLAPVLAELSQGDPTMQWLRGDPQAMRRLLDEFGERENARLAVRGAPDVAFIDAPGQSSPRAVNVPRRPPGGLIGPRLQIFDAQGEWVAGRGQPGNQPVLEEPVLQNGLHIATLRVTEEVDGEVIDSYFLQRQYQGFAAAAALALVLSVLLGGWLVRRWSRPLTAVQDAAKRIAAGEFAVRVPGQGAYELQRLGQNINQMAQALQQLEQSRRTWIAHNSHELRTPLAVLLGEIESIQDGVRKATPEVLESLREEVLQLARLVNDLHLLAVADIGALRCEFIDGDATTSLQRVARRLEHRLTRHGLSLELQGPASLPVCWDFGRVEQLLINLLENTIRYTDAPGRVSLMWQVLAAAGQVLITLDDSPPGVTDAQLQEIFEPLFRVDTARQRTQAHAGSGLGLAIARVIVAAHHGAIEARHSALGGLQLRVVLPINATVGED